MKNPTMGGGVKIIHTTTPGMENLSTVCVTVFNGYYLMRDYCSYLSFAGAGSSSSSRAGCSSGTGHSAAFSW